MSFFSKQQLEEIINSGEFNRLKGKYENDWFDCKKEPYRLLIEKDKQELAKDISSFANVEGGYILLGAKTRGDEAHSGEQITEISPFGKNLVDIEQNIKIIESGIYPNIEGLNIDWYPDREDDTKGLVLIKIPSQNSSLKPFLTKKVWNGGKIAETIFGLFQRRGDKSLHYELGDLHRLIQLGQQYEKNMQGRFDALELMIQGVTKNSSSGDVYKKKFEERRKITLTKNRQLGERILVLTGFIEGNGKIRNFDSSDEIKNLPNRYTQPLRDGGWKLLYSANPTVNSSDLIEVGYESNNLSLYSDGAVIYVRTLDQLSLFNSLSLIISIALIETVFQFADFYKQFINEIEGDVKKIIIGIELNELNKDGKETKLSFNLRPGGFDEPHKSPENSLKTQLEIDKDFDAKALAFQILKVIYQWFGFNQNPPFTKIESDVGMVDLEQITRS